MAVSHLDATLLSRRIEHHVRGRNSTLKRLLADAELHKAALKEIARGEF